MVTGESHRILALWSVPRARSTAFLRMMCERGDHVVLHEPFSHLIDFGETVVDGRTVCDETQLIRAIRLLSRRRPVFLKDTTDFHYPGLLADSGFLAELRHAFLIRDPDEVIASHFALNPALACPEVGFERLAEIHDAAISAGAANVVVLDSDDLVTDPEGLVAAYCHAAGINFRRSALAWQPGVLPDWEKTRRWHESTAATSGFSPRDSRYSQRPDNNPELAAYRDHHLPFYRRLRERRLAPLSAAQTAR